MARTRPPQLPSSDPNWERTLRMFQAGAPEFVEGCLMLDIDHDASECPAARERYCPEGEQDAHAELLAVSKAGRALKEWRLSDCSLAVTLELAIRKIANPQRTDRPKRRPPYLREHVSGARVGCNDEQLARD